MEARDGSGAEIEWQLEVQDLRPVLRWLEQARADGASGVAVGRASSVTHVDTYLDTRDRRLDRAGFTVRIRRAPQLPPELTLKSLVAIRSDALRVRRELSQELDPDEGTMLLQSGGPVTDRVLALVGARKLTPLVEVQTRRRAFALTAEGAPSGELALDDTVIREPGARRLLGRLCRIEVEAPEQALQALRPLVESLQQTFGLQPAVLSKYEAALAVSGRQRIEAETFGPTSIGPGSTIGEVALAVLRRQLATLLAKEPGTRLGDDVEDLHDMRVATRRLRAAVALFEDVLPAEVLRLRPELTWLGQTIGAVRDLDVQIGELDGWIATAPEQDQLGLTRIHALLESQRTHARAELLRALDSPRYHRLVHRFGATLRARSGIRTPPAPAAAPALVQQRQRQVRKWLKRVRKGHTPAAYHRLRIADKRFRYALEFLSDVYPGETDVLVRHATDLQDLLGVYQDGHVAAMRLRELAISRADDLGVEAVFAMGGLAERYRAGMEAARLEVEPAAARLRGNAWKRLHKRLLTA
jgi:CHAD domain-containing protein